MKKILLLILSISLFASANSQDVKGYVVEAKDSIKLNGEYFYLDSPIDGEVIKRVGGKWTNGTGGAGSASVDSITWDFSNGYLGWYISGSVADSLSLDNRYILLENESNFVAVADSGVSYYTKHQTDSVLSSSVQIVYTFTLPVAGTLAQSVALVSDLPDGWTLTASGTNLLIEHNLNRSLANVGVKYNQSGTTFRSLVPFQTAFNTFQDDDLNNAQIISISNYFTQYALKVHLTFD